MGEALLVTLSQGLPNHVQGWLMESRPWLGGWERRGMTSQCYLFLFFGSFFSFQNTEVFYGILWWFFFFSPRHKFIYCSRSLLSEHVLLTSEDAEPSHGKWKKKLLILNIQRLCSLHNSRRGMHALLLPACVLLYLIFSFFIMMVHGDLL